MTYISGSTSSAGIAVVTRHTVGTRKPTAFKPSACATKKRGKQRQAKPDYLNSEAIEHRSITKKGEKYGVVTIQERTNNKDDAIEEDAAMGVRESSGEV
nr:hypothetical protein [Tanacetum cinerariifolium]